MFLMIAGVKELPAITSGGTLMNKERKAGDRVQFEHGYAARIMGIDGTWQRDVLLEDVSDGEAKLTVFGSVEDINLDEFFLVLSTWGHAHRRCERVWLNGDQVGVRFLKTAQAKVRRERKRPKFEMV